MPRPKLLASALALGVAAASLQPSVATAQQASTVGGPASLVPADLAFVLHAASDSLAEVALGKLAQEKAGSQEVKQFGQRMVEEHTKANEELAQLAGQVNTKLPQQPSDVAQEIEKTLAAYAGQDFDAVYIAQQVGAHETAVALFEHAAEHAEAPGVRDYARKQAPIIKQHLEQAQALMKEAGEKG